MCGIAGRFHPIALPNEPAWHTRVTSLLAHRGPDGTGRYVDDHCELVHRRLAIVDLSLAGQQPMTNEDGTIRVTFNGEIYNHRELRAELKTRGHEFRSSADTEVLVHLYEEYGTQMVNRLRGMFAFGLYDQKRKTLMLSRDRFGIKPLYYTTLNGELVFASEIKAITALNGFKPEIDRQACYDYLSLGYIPEPSTGFKNVSALPAATVLVADAKGQRISKFYQLKARPEINKPLREAARAVSEDLLDAVQSQSVADVPVAALLSGGIDSSLVVAAYRRAANVSPQTFNVRFPDKGYDETAVAVAVAEHCDTDHQTIDLSDWAVTPESVIDLLRHFDQPFADTSLIPMYWVARAIRERGIVCTLSGDGGDEAFGGYARFWRANKLAALAKLPWWIQSSLASTGSSLAGWTRDRGRQLEKAVRLAQQGWKDAAVLLAGLSSYQNEEQKQQLVAREARDNLRPVERHFNGYSPAGVRDLEELSQRMTENLFAVGLTSDMLRKVDMMSMRASIEVRVPFLDEQVVERGLSLPHTLKTNGKEGKLVLRELAADWLPSQVTTHRKQGFSIPLDVMVTEPFHVMLQDHLLSDASRISSFIDSGITSRWLERFKWSRQGHHSDGTMSRGGLYQRIVILLSLELWMRQYNLSW
jgi:asparagine synthase (glutamine-hydrolysing)